MFVLPAGFKRKRAPSAKPRAHPEDDLQVSVAAHLDWMLSPPATYTAIGHGGFSLGKTREEAIRRGARMKKRGVKPGWPDLIVLFNSRSHGIELKAKDGRLSDDQKSVRDQIIAAGGTYEVCRSVEAVVDHLTALGVPLRSEKPRTALLLAASSRMAAAGEQPG